MEKNNIIIILEILIIILLIFGINRIEKKTENYDTGYNQNTTFRDCTRHLIASQNDVEFLEEKKDNKIDYGQCDCNLQYLKMKFTN